MAEPFDYFGLGSNIKRLYDTGEYSDLIVTCGDDLFSPIQTLSAHKVVLGCQSEKLRALISPSKQGEESKIHVSEFTSPVVKTMMRHFYYKTLDLSECPESMHHSVFTIVVHFIACRFGAEQLRKLAIDRLSNICDPVRDAEDFIAAMERAHDSRGHQDTEHWIHTAVWDVLLPKAAANVKLLLKHESFTNFLETVPGLAVEVLKSVAAEECAFEADTEVAPTAGPSTKQDKTKRGRKRKVAPTAGPSTKQDEKKGGRKRKVAPTAGPSTKQDEKKGGKKRKLTKSSD